MKTESEYENLFLQNCSIESEEQNKDFLKALSQNYWRDLTGHLTAYFSHEDREAITLQAANLLKTNLQKGQTVQTAWESVIRDFVTRSSWGYKSQNKKPEKKLTEEQKNSRKLFRYGWAFFQSMIILKIAVYYFGLESAQHPEETSVFWVWFFFLVSVSSLIYFAYRNREDKD